MNRFRIKDLEIQIQPFVTPLCCHWPTPCLYPSPHCVLTPCLPFTPCHYPTPGCLFSPCKAATWHCPGPTLVECGPGSPYAVEIDKTKWVVQPEVLVELKAGLKQVLEEIEVAEREVAQLMVPTEADKAMLKEKLTAALKELG